MGGKEAGISTMDFQKPAPPTLSRTHPPAIRHSTGGTRDRANVSRCDMNCCSVVLSEIMRNRRISRVSTFIMNSDTLAIGLDRLRFYAKDAVVTLAQVGENTGADADLVHMQTVG